MRKTAIYLAVLISLTTANVYAENCVKVWNDSGGDNCMEFSQAERKKALQYGVRLGSPYKTVRKYLIRNGWTINQSRLKEESMERPLDGDLVCGSGWDAVCSTYFIRKKSAIMLTFSAANDGIPLTGIDAADAETLETPSFVIKIDVRCAEGNVTCDDVIYSGTSKKTQKSIVLRGRTMHSKCADGVTPCQFQGYLFTSGHARYTITQDGELIVMQGEKTLVQERGTWK